MSTPDIPTHRLRLVALVRENLEALTTGSRPPVGFRVPDWWPDETDLTHLQEWLRDASGHEGNDGWRPRGIVNRDGELIGHAGFHQPPTTIEAALADPNYVGDIDPSAGGVVELGYTVFPEHRGRGYATEAAAALIEWAWQTGQVSTILASVSPTNEASRRVLDRLDGFVEIGRCSDEADEELVFRCDR